MKFQFDDTFVNFKVDEAERTITGLAVPYGPAARNGGRKWVFQKGSVTWNPEAVNRIKLLLDHDHSAPVGKAIKLEETDSGLVATFQVARGEKGNQALIEAADGVRDGLSIGIELGGREAFESMSDGASRVKVGGATLREITLTAMPAFDEARISHVGAFAADNKEGSNMDENQTPGVDTDAITEAIKAGFAASRPVAVTTTSEAPLYVFDGRSRGKHDFSTDLFAAYRGDHEAEKRVNDFMAANFDITQAGVASLNPSKQRPDMYVDQREYTYPLWQRVFAGNITDNTPFILPKFSASSGLVAAHVEGDEPTPGSFTATSQTVTPSAVSGKVLIPQELVDAGGNPQVSSLIWRQIVRAYNEALEAEVATVLNAATLTGQETTITTAAADDALAAEIKALVISKLFVRGGQRFDTMALHVDLYSALAKAVDADGRPLFPALGATNADGAMGNLFATLNLNGVQGLPVWALGATSTGSSNSYWFDRYAVRGWASAPKRIEFRNEVANVTLGVFGYKVVAIIDTPGVQRIKYDPAA